MIIYHYSNEYIKDYIKPCYFGQNSYSTLSTRRSLIKRAYFYLLPKIKEALIYGKRYRYTCNISKYKLYNLKTDKLNLLDKYSNNFHKILQYIKRKGYCGIIGTQGCWDIAEVFYNIKIIKSK